MNYLGKQFRKKDNKHRKSLMKTLEHEMQELLYELEEHSTRVYDQDYQQDLLRGLKISLPSRAAFRLAILAVENYGFAVLPMLRPLYSQLTSKETLELRNQLEHIEAIAVKLVGKNSFAQFPELAFLKHFTINQRLTSTNDFRKDLPSKIYSQATQFTRHLRIIKSETAKIAKYTEKDVNLLASNYNKISQRLRPKKTFNLFQELYHRSELEKLLNELRILRDMCHLRHASQEMVNAYIEKVQRGVQYLSFERKNSLHLQKSQETSSFQVDLNDIDFAQFQSQDIHNEKSPEPDSRQLRLPQEQKPFRKVITPQVPKRAQETESKYLCCRTFFYVNQIIEEAESLRREYKCYKFPFQRENLNRLCRTIVGFLNSYGGIIYLGIKEQDNRLRKVTGLHLNEKEKEELLVTIRQLADRISPDIVFARLFEIKFVPLKGSKNNWLSGHYVVKIIVQMGRPKEMYYYSMSQEEGVKVAFRTENQVLVRDPKIDMGKLLELYKTRLIDAPRAPIFDHKQPCREPESGLFSYGFR